MVSVAVRGSAFFLFCAVFLAAHTAHAQLSPEKRAALETELSRIEAEIAAQRSQLELKQRERTSLERDVAILDAQIETAKLSIRQRDLAIQRLQSDIRDKQNAIGVLDERVLKGQDSIGQLLRLTQAIDDTSMVELALGKSFSDIFVELDEFEMIHTSLRDSFAEMAIAREDLSARKAALEAQRSEEQELRQIQVLQRQELERAEKEKSSLVAAAKGQEKVYQQIIADKQRSAATIRSALFDLRDSGAIPFGTAYQYAKEASAATGVRPAVILAVLRQETNLGENVGQCLLTNSPNKGDGKGKNTGRAFSQVMKGSRDVDHFMQITAELGLDPLSQVVSCPPSYGFGGAMGPAQFIPSTWVLYKERIAKLTGQNPPNPWSARTAIFATALLMMDNGADAGTRSAERLAALRYFAGWGNANKSAYAFYGDSVMRFADDYQADIDVLER
jgi:peptidoglycan hydrolase CwlO-like protein